MKHLLNHIDMFDENRLEEVNNMGIEDVIGQLKDGNFSNMEKRKDFLKLLTILALSNDPKARMLVKKMSKWLDEIGDEFLTVKDKEKFETQDGNENYEVPDYETPEGVGVFENHNSYGIAVQEAKTGVYGILNETEVKKESGEIK